MNRTLFGLVTFIACLAAACGAGDRPGEQAAENTPGPNTPRWRLPVDSPLVAIGASDDPDYDLEAGAEGRRFRDGRLIIATGGDWPVRVYGADGRLIKKYRRGAGPEEWGRGDFAVKMIGGDTAGVGDFLNGPIKLVSPTLEVTRQIPRFAPPGGKFFPTNQLPDGRWLGVRYPMANDPRRFAKLNLPNQWVMASADMKWDTVLHEVPASAGVPTFGARTLNEVGGDQLYVTLNHSPEIEVWGLDGKLRHRIRLNLPSEPVTDEDRDKYLVATIANMKDNGADDQAIETARNRSKSELFAKTFAFFEWLTVADDSTLWITRLDRGLNADTEFLIISPAGKLIAMANLPRGYWILQPASDAILLSHRDSEDRVIISVVPIRRQ